MEKNQNKPNVVFIFSDQQRHDTMGCYGQKLDITPNLDKMASEGTLFNNAFTCQPVCGPARATLQTGKYAERTGCFRNHISLKRDGDPFLADIFNANGYQTGYIGKWHLASNGGDCEDDIGEETDYNTKAVPENLRGGYKDYWMAADILEFTSHDYDGYMYDINNKRHDFPKDRYRVDAVTDYVEDFIGSRDNENPFFLFVSFIEPHHQNDMNVYQGPKGSKEKFANYEVPGDLVGTEGDWKENYPDYLGCCNSLDENVGRIRKSLEDNGFGDNTVIIYTSDHGSHFRTRNDEYKRACHDNCTHIPMIAWGPGFEGGSIINELTSLIDIPPTLLKSAGIETPTYMDGNAMQPLVEWRPVKWQQSVFMQISESQVGRAVRTKDWKYSVRAYDKEGWYHARSETYTEDFLYDLKNDPFEKNNLICNSDYAEQCEIMKKILLDRMEQAGEKRPEILPCI